MEHVIEPNKETFASFQNKLVFLLTQEYVDKNLHDRYHPIEIEQLYIRACAAGYAFNSAEEVDDFYTNYAIRNQTNGRYLEDIEDRLLWCALEAGKGDSIKALRYLDALLAKDITVSTDVLFNAGRHPSCHKTD